MMNFKNNNQEMVKKNQGNDMKSIGTYGNDKET